MNSSIGLFVCFFRAGDAMKKILKDQEEFEKEHQFMQVWISYYSSPLC